MIFEATHLYFIANHFPLSLPTGRQALYLPEKIGKDVATIGAIVEWFVLKSAKNTAVIETNTTVFEGNRA